MTDPQKNSEIPHPDQETRIAVVEIDHKVSQDIESDIWKKYILNCAHNVSTACYNNTIGELRKNPDKAKEYEKLIYEAYEVAAAKGVNIQK